LKIFTSPEVPIVLGNEGAGVVEEGGGADFPAGSRVMFWGAYGAFEDGTYREWIAVRKEDLCPIPDNVDDVNAAGIPVPWAMRFGRIDEERRGVPAVL
jgi:NADPH2:quinone reductase